MADLTNYAKNKLRDFAFRTATLSKPTNWYVALFTVAPTVAGGGTEVSGGSYARVACNPGDANWSAPADGQAANAAAIVFALPTADWGTVVAVGLFDADPAGNLWIFDTLATPRTVSLGEAPPQFDAGALVGTFA